MLTVSLLLLVSGFICTIASLAGKVPLWVGVVLLYVWALLTVLPR